MPYNTSRALFDLLKEIQSSSLSHVLPCILFYFVFNVNQFLALYNGNFL